MKLPSALLLAPQHTARPVDARWQRITDLADRGEPALHRWDDAWVRRGLDFLNRLRACQTEADRERLAQDLPDLDTAHRLHASADPLPRAILEARLLAGLSVADAATTCSLTQATV